MITRTLLSLCLLLILPVWAEAPDAGESAYVQYLPWQPGKELDLFRLEGVRFVRSEPVISPDHQQFAYSEVVYTPHNRQTFSRIYVVPVVSLESAPPSLPSERLPESIKDAAYYQSRLDPDKTTRIRKELLGVGSNRSVAYEFRTLTVVDWSASGQRMLFKQRSGVVHTGLRTSDVLVYDRSRGAVTIYPEIQRILEHYWRTHGNLPDLTQLAWDIYPLGWAQGSDSVVIFKAWAYDKTSKKFLGAWQYDIDAQRTNLVSLTDEPLPVVANGLLPDFQSPLKGQVVDCRKRTLRDKLEQLRFWEK